MKNFSFAFSLVDLRKFASKFLLVLLFPFLCFCAISNAQSQSAGDDPKVQSFYAEAKAAQAKGADDTTIDTYATQLTRINGDFESQRDVVIESLAKALAVGGPYAKQARDMVEPMFKQKHDNSLDGLDPLIMQKKTELAALTPVAAPGIMSVTPAAVGAAGGKSTGGGKAGGK